MANITKEKPVEILRGLLETDADLAFLMQLKKTEMETFVACSGTGLRRFGNKFKGLAGFTRLIFGILLISHQVQGLRYWQVIIHMG